MGGSKARRARRELIFGKSLKKRKLEAKQAAQAAAASRQKAGDDYISLDTAPEPVDTPKKEKVSKKRKTRDDDDAEHGTPKAAKTSGEASAETPTDGEAATNGDSADNKGGVQIDGEFEKPLAKKPRRPAKVKPEGEPEGSKNRFICFVGNLPFSITQKKVEAHFASLQPKGIRLATDKKGKHGKGYGFIEFNDYDRMKTCLEKFHHSEIEDPTGKAMRKINIELTAGGGGHHSLDRKSKIQIKNMRLQEQRERRKKLDAERKTKGKTPTERALEKKAKREQAEQAEQAGADAASAPANGELFTMDGEGVHPSRLARMQG